MSGSWGGFFPKAMGTLLLYPANREVYTAEGRGGHMPWLLFPEFLAPHWKPGTLWGSVRARDGCKLYTKHSLSHGPEIQSGTSVTLETGLGTVLRVYVLDSFTST